MAKLPKGYSSGINQTQPTASQPDETIEPNRLRNPTQVTNNPNPIGPAARDPVKAGPESSYNGMPADPSPLERKHHG
jgi:hypothetical protein